MNSIDENLESNIKSGSLDKKNYEWLKTHTLSQEQVAQLIFNKIERAKIYQRKVNDKFYYD
jgi:hypothetical protein